MRTTLIGSLVITATAFAIACGSNSNSDTTGTGGGLGKGGSGGAIDSGGAGGGGIAAPIDSGATAGSIVSLEMTWASSADAGATLYGAIVKPDGSATCQVYDTQNLWKVVGQSAQPDQEIKSLLAQQDVVTALATTCLLNIADVDPPITTTFADGSIVKHLVFGSCATAALTELTTAVRRVCNAIATTNIVRDQ